MMKRRLSSPSLNTEGERGKEQFKKAKQEQEEKMEDKKTYLVRVATTLCFFLQLSSSSFSPFIRQLNLKR